MENKQVIENLIKRYIGQEETIIKLIDKLTSNERLIYISGTIGTGKTSITNEALNYLNVPFTHIKLNEIVKYNLSEQAILRKLVDRSSQEKASNGIIVIDDYDEDFSLRNKAVEVVNKLKNPNITIVNGKPFDKKNIKLVFIARKRFKYEGVIVFKPLSDKEYERILNESLNTPLKYLPYEKRTEELTQLLLEYNRMVNEGARGLISGCAKLQKYISKEKYRLKGASNSNDEYLFSSYENISKKTNIR